MTRDGKLDVLTGWQFCLPHYYSIWHSLLVSHILLENDLIVLTCLFPLNSTVFFVFEFHTTKGSPIAFATSCRGIIEFPCSFTSFYCRLFCDICGKKILQQGVLMQRIFPLLCNPMRGFCDIGLISEEGKNRLNLVLNWKMEFASSFYKGL